MGIETAPAHHSEEVPMKRVVALAVLVLVAAMPA
jgi:hypothetical protein